MIIYKFQYGYFFFIKEPDIDLYICNTLYMLNNNRFASLENVVNHYFEKVLFCIIITFFAKTLSAFLLSR